MQSMGFRDQILLHAKPETLTTPNSFCAEIDPKTRNPMEALCISVPINLSYPKPPKSLKPYNV